jgi:hypothetical protein
MAIKKTKLGWYIIIVIVAFVSIASLFQKPPTPAPVPTLKAVHNSSYDGSVRQAKEYLIAHLKDPDSYQSVKWFNVVEVNGAIDGLEKAMFTVRHTYRAKNSFGGYNVETCIFFLDGSGEVIKMNKES